MTIGIIHPGAMGTSLGAALVATGHEVAWASDGRSEATRARAERDGLIDRTTLAALSAEAEVILSVCPPGAATTVAAEIAGLGFDGIYVDANAVAPHTARAIEAELVAAGATVVDGGIVGPPARRAGLTVLYLSGDPAGREAVADLFTGSPLETHPLDAPAGAASAVKMAFAAWTKGTGALLLAARALAEAEGVVDGLDHAWSTRAPDLPDRLSATAAATAPKAWRFVAEMEEIAASFAAAGLPSGFHTAAAQVYERLTDLRDTSGVGLDDVMTRLAPPDPPTDV